MLDKVNFRPDIRKNIFLKKIRTSRVCVAFNPFATMGVVNDPLCQIRSEPNIFENFTAIFGMCSLEVSVLIQERFPISSESFPYHKIFLKH